MMRVCHMTSAHGSQDGRIFYKECVSLAKAGYEVYEVAHGESCEKNGVHIVGVGNEPGSRMKRMLFDAKRVYQKARELDCDIYHFHDPELLPYGLKLKKAGKKVIFDSHENTVEQIKEKTWIPNLIRKPAYVLFDWYQKHACARLDAVVSVTPHICDYFRAINPNTHMITNYPILAPLPEHRERKAGSMCFAGGIDVRWNHEEIIRAMETIEESSYVLCGNGKGEYFESLKALPAWKRVDFKGRLPFDQVSAVLNTCQIGMAVLMYNNNTGFDIGTMGVTKVFEEMMLGQPIICTDFKLWKEFVERYHCGICVKPGSVAEIANAIRYLIDHPEEARRMGENGRRAVEQEFNWNFEEKKLLELYRELSA